MSRPTTPLLPSTERFLKALGERIRLARMRRGLSQHQVAERAGMARKTLVAIERGLPSPTLGAIAAVLQVLQLEQSISLLAAEDSLGRALQDKALQARAKPHLRTKLVNPSEPNPQTLTAPTRDVDKAGTTAVTSDHLLGLLDLRDKDSKQSTAGDGAASRPPRRRSPKE